MIASEQRAKPSWFKALVMRGDRAGLAVVVCGIVLGPLQFIDMPAVQIAMTAVMLAVYLHYFRKLVAPMAPFPALGWAVGICCLSVVGTSVAVLAWRALEFVIAA